MKSKITTVLSTVAALVAVLWIAGVAGANPLAMAGPPARPNLQSGAPTVVSYQGQVTVGGAPYDGTGYFKFAIVDAAGTATYWSNDGTSSGGGEPKAGLTERACRRLLNLPFILSRSTWACGFLSPPLSLSPVI